MVATITPLVRVAVSSFWKAWTGHFVAAIAGGSLLGLLVALFGRALSLNASVLPLAVAVTFLYAWREVGIVRLPAIDHAAAVPFAWRVRFGAVRAAWLYGFALGFGFSARTPFTSFHVMLVWLLMLGDPIVGATIGAVYGMTRALVPLFAIALSPHSGNQADALSGLAVDQRLMHLANGAVLAFVSAQAAIGLMRQ